MPTLDIKPDDLKSPTAAVLDRIGSIMLFPHDEARRARLLDAAHNRFVLEQMRFIDRMGDDISLPLEDVIRLVETRDATPRLEDIHADRDGTLWTAMTHGHVVGLMLVKLLARRAREPNDRKALENVKEEIRREFALYKREGRGWDISLSTVNVTILPRYRCVAHLWASWRQRLKETNFTAFPCRASDLGIFLADAEWLRVAGERTETGKGPFLKPGQTWRVPDDIDLPAVDFTFNAAP